MNNIVIGISGPSGVGKTTISHLLSYHFNIKDVLILSGDDLHKWERNDINWKNYTHFNPDANNLNIGLDNITDLKNGKSIYRKKYNHNTGKFDTEIKIDSKPIIIYEGLHSLYGEEICKLLDLKIYVDTNQSLTTEWKMKRDTLSRGYTSNEVIQTMNRRKQDEIEFIIPQKKNADVIVKFEKNKEIKLDYIIKNELSPYNCKLVKSLKKNYKVVSKFLKICDFLSTDINLVQGKGGNVSIKYENKFIVKSSGFKIQDVTFTEGFTICNRVKKVLFENEYDYEYFSKQLIFNSNSNPSMEVGFHNHINYKFIIHTHPIFLNTILCSKDSKKIIDSLFSDFDYEFVEYLTPGFKLSNFFVENKKSKIFFLENHGLIVCSNNLKETIQLTKKINSTCRNWLETNGTDFIKINKKINTKPLFPDSVIFGNELQEINNHIISLIYKVGLSPKFLTSDEINELNKSELEKYRKNG